MRKFYSIVNVITFIFLIMYTMCNSPNSQLQQGAMVLGIFSLLASGYMIFFEYTDDTVEQYKKQVTNIKQTYKSKLDEMTEKEKYIHGIQQENQQLVGDLSLAKNIVKELVNKIEVNNGSTITDLQTNENFTPDMSNMNYHIETNELATPLINPDVNSGPIINQNSGNNSGDDIKKRMSEYQKSEFNQPPSVPPVPAFLRPMETKPSSNQHMVD